jgi:hypothetical protein
MEKALDCRAAQKDSLRVAEPGRAFVERGKIHLSVGISFGVLKEKEKLIWHFGLPSERRV